MRCVGCGSAAVTERPERTARGYRRFRCRDCGRQFNERSGGRLNRAQYPSDVVALVVLWRLRYRLTLRDLAEMFLQRGIVFSSAKAATGAAPERVTTDGHGSYPRAIRSTLGRRVVHRTSAFKNNGLEQDHRGIKGRIRCMRGFKGFASAERFCRSHDELRDFLRPRTRHNQLVSVRRRRLLHLRRAADVLAILEAA
jgi:transposase-like protein